MITSGGQNPEGGPDVLRRKKGIMVIEPHFLLEMVEPGDDVQPISPGVKGVA